MTRDLFHGLRTAKTRRLAPSLKNIAQRKLDMLDAAGTLGDLAVLPGNRLESLGADWEGNWSIRVNRQWRLVFRWTDKGPAWVRLIDYHS